MSRFPAEIASLRGSKLYYKGLYGHISDLEHFLLYLIFTPTTDFLACIDNY